MPSAAHERFLSLLRAAVDGGHLVKLTLGHYRGSDVTLENVTVRPVTLKAGPHLSFVWRHRTKHVTRNLPPASALEEVTRLFGAEFLDGHLFATTGSANFQTLPDGRVRLKLDATPVAAAPAAAGHDAAKSYLIPPDAPWLRALGVTNDRAQPREGMADKFRQIQKFAELLQHLVADARLPADQPVRVVDMGAGKGYLTFAVAALLGERASVRGIELRPALVDLCNQLASAHHLSPRLAFAAGSIADTPLDAVDVLIALHACDTATDDALARGLAAEARLLVVSPCCQKELRPQLTAPPVLADALQHGIFQERQAEFVTDSLRAQLLEWAGYRTKVFEFISTEHTAKNLMIAATKARPRDSASSPLAERIRSFARFYGIRSQRLATHLDFSLIS